METLAIDKFQNAQRGRGPVTDLAIASAIAAMAVTISIVLGLQLPAVVYVEFDKFFGADIGRVFDAMTGQNRIGHYRSTVHPIFSFLVFPPTRALIALGFAPIAACHIVVALCAGVTAAIVFGFARCLQLSRLDSILLCFLLLSSATFIFWWSVPETFAFGGMSVALVFLISAIRSVPFLLQVVVSSLALAFTTTNWAAALIAAFASRSRWQAFQVSVIGFVVVVVMAVWQWAFLPSARFFFLPASVSDELTYVPLMNADAYSISLVDRLSSLLLMPWVASAANLSAAYGIRPDHFSYGPVGWIALLAIVLIFALVVETIRVETPTRWLIVAPAIFLLFQFALHMIYGDEPFLYAAHFMPPLICIAAIAFLGPRRNLARLLVGVFVLTAGYTNVTSFLDVANQLATLPGP